MRKVFIAGKYNAKDVIELAKNIAEGVSTAQKLMSLGYAPYCPWLDFQLVLFDQQRRVIEERSEGSYMLVEAYQDTSMAYLEVCDAVFMVLGWEESKGAKREKKRAEELNIPIYYSFKEIVENCTTD